MDKIQITVRGISKDGFKIGVIKEVANAHRALSVEAEESLSIKTPAYVDLIITFQTERAADAFTKSIKNRCLTSAFGVGKKPLDNVKLPF